MIPADYESRILRGERLRDVFASEQVGDRAGGRTDEREAVLDGFVLWLERTELLESLDRVEEVVKLLADELPAFAQDREFLSAIESECDRRYARGCFGGEVAGINGSYGPSLVDGEGRYRLIARLGSGSQAVVFQAIDRQFGSSNRSVVAIKIFDGVDQQEGIRAKSVDHPNVVKVYDQGIDLHGRPTGYIVYEYLDGFTLRAWAQRRELATGDVIGLLVQLCDGVQAIHNAMIIHRDLKPENIIMSDDRPVIADFGIAVDGLGDQLPAGSPAYMAPEQGAGTGDSAMVDIYGIGAVAYFLLVGRPPDRADGEDVACDEIGHRRLRAVVEKCLRHHPSSRYKSPSEISADLRAILAHRPVSVYRERAVRAGVLAVRRRPVVFLGVLIFIGALVAVVINQAYIYRHQASEMESLRWKETKTIRLNEYLRSGLQQMVLEMRLREGPVDPAEFWLIDKLANQPGGAWEMWTHSTLVSAEGAELLRDQVFRLTAEGKESNISLGYWWWLLARIQKHAKAEADQTIESYHNAEKYLMRGLAAEDDPLLLQVRGEWLAWEESIAGGAGVP